MLFVKTFIEYMAVRKALKAAKNSEKVAEQIIQRSNEISSPYQDGEGCQTIVARTSLSRGYGRYTTETAGFRTAPSAGVEPLFAEEYHRLASTVAQDVPNVEPIILDENPFLKGCQEASEKHRFGGAGASGDWNPPAGFERGGEADQFHDMLGQRKLMQAMDDSVIRLRQEARLDEKVQDMVEQCQAEEQYQADLSDAMGEESNKDADRRFRDRITSEAGYKGEPAFDAGVTYWGEKGLTVAEPVSGGHQFTHEFASHTNDIPQAKSPQEIDTTGPEEAPETSSESD